jgi:hypothetical protein
MHKVIDMGNGLLHIFGSNKPIRIEQATPSWASEPQDYFRFKNRREYLANFTYTGGYSKELKAYDGIENWSFSNGCLVKYNEDDDNETVFAYYYYITSYPV